MVHVLKHMAFRIWLTVLLGSAAAFLFLPMVQKRWGLEWIIVVVVPIFIVVFLAIAWMSHRIGLQMVKRLIREAGIWERAGNIRHAEKTYQKAAAIFDSFLMSPLRKEKHAPRLTGQMARFYLAQTEINPKAEAVITAYLKSHPEDQSVAEAWLQQFETMGRPLKSFEDIAYLIGSAQPANRKIQTLLARLYLSRERTDFQALQTYRRLIEADDFQDVATIHNLADLFFEEKRIDEWALQIYLKSYERDAKRKHLLKAIAACLHWTRESTALADVFEQARALMSGFEPAAQEKMREGFRPVPAIPIKKADRPRAEYLRSIIHKAGKKIASIASFLRSTIWSTARISSKVYRRIRDDKKLTSILRWAVIGLAGVGLVMLAFNTATHLIQTKPEIPEVKETAAVVVTDPFTLQVAAYLKPEHAEKYTAHLKSLGLDAYWTEAQGAKTKWYQVRLSHFPDKASARAYGDSLKAKGIIDDFYVANYQRP